MNRQNGFANFFVFANIFDTKALKSLVRLVVDYADTQLFL